MLAPIFIADALSGLTPQRVLEVRNVAREGLADDSGHDLREFQLALAVVCTIFGHTVYNWSLRYLPAPVISTSLLGEPILASLLALVLLGEVPIWTVVLAAPLILIGVGLTAMDRKQ